MVERSDVTRTKVNWLSELRTLSNRRRMRLHELEEEEEQFFEKVEKELQRQETVDVEYLHELEQKVKTSNEALRFMESKLRELELELSRVSSIKEKELQQKERMINQLTNTTATIRKQYKENQETSQTADVLKAELENVKAENVLLGENIVSYVNEINRLKLELERANQKIVAAESVAAMTKLREMESLRKQSTEMNEIRVDLEETVRKAAADHSKQEHVKRLQEVYEELSQKISVKTVAAKMFQRDGLTLKELESIQCSRSPSKAAETLLNILLHQPYEVYECFLEALRESDQEDVYLCLIYKDYNMDVQHAATIRQHYVYLMDTMDTKYSGLVEHLYSVHVIDQGEKDDITATESCTRRNENLLSMLSRKSAEQFGQFLEALDITGQRHVAKVVRGGFPILGGEKFEETVDRRSGLLETQPNEDMQRLKAENVKLKKKSRIWWRWPQKQKHLEFNIMDED